MYCLIALIFCRPDQLHVLSVMTYITNIIFRAKLLSVERTTSLHCIGGLVGPRTDMEAFERRRISCLCRKSSHSSSVVQPVAESLYGLSYLGSIYTNQDLRNEKVLNYQSTSTRTHRVSVTNMNWFVVLMEIIATYSAVCTKATNKL